MFQVLGVDYLGDDYTLFGVGDGGGRRPNAGEEVELDEVRCAGAVDEAKLADMVSRAGALPWMTRLVSILTVG